MRQEIFVTELWLSLLWVLLRLDFYTPVQSRLQGPPAKSNLLADNTHTLTQLTQQEKN
jgi:hypothetical protein